MDRFTLQPGAGSAAIYANVAMIRAYHAARGEATSATRSSRRSSRTPRTRPAPKIAGFKVITLYPDADGYPDLDALKAAVSERTAALLITNPEDTGIFNPRIDEFVRVVHEAGGLCSYDQANANGILGITRAREAGLRPLPLQPAQDVLDAARLRRPGRGRLRRDRGARAVPAAADGRVRRRRATSSTTTGRSRSARSAPGYGVVPNLVRAYAWIMSLGAEGLREVAEIAVLNNNYLHAAGPGDPRRHGAVRDGPAPDRAGPLQLGGAGAGDRRPLRGDRAPHRRLRDALLDEPPPVRRARADDARADRVVLEGRPRRVRRDPGRTSPSEAYEDPERVRTAPHASTVHQIDHAPLDDPARWAVTWRAYRRKHPAVAGDARSGPAAPARSRPTAPTASASS